MQNSTSIFRGSDKDRTLSWIVLSVLKYRSIVLVRLGIAVGFSHGFCGVGAWWSKIRWSNAVEVWVFFLPGDAHVWTSSLLLLGELIVSYSQQPSRKHLEFIVDFWDTGRLDYLLIFIDLYLLIVIDFLQNPMDQTAFLAKWSLIHLPLWGASQNGLMMT